MQNKQYNSVHKNAEIVFDESFFVSKLNLVTQNV